MHLTVALRALLLVCLVVSGGCTFVSTGARSAIVVLVRQEVTTGGVPLPMPPRDELKAALSPRFLSLADDARSAQWIAYIDVRTPPTPLQPFGLTVIEVKKNPRWDPLAVSDGFSRKDTGTHPSLSLAEQNEQRERSQASSSR